MKKEVRTFAEYISDESRVTAAEREEINSEVELIGKMIKSEAAKNIKPRELHYNSTHV